MILADRVGQCSTQFVVRDNGNGRMWKLNNTADHAATVAKCRVRYVLEDDLTRLCADLAYSKGARALAWADLLRMPATQLWVEWCNKPWQLALQRYGFPIVEAGRQWVGRRGALVSASPDGRSGMIRTFWSTGDGSDDVLASSIESYFDLDAAEGESPDAPGQQEWRQAGQVRDETIDDGDDVLARCFRFRYERSWAEYYANAGLPQTDSERLWRHTLGTIALDVPLLFSFILLLLTRSGLPQRSSNLERLNRARSREGKSALLEHLIVRAPFLPEYSDQQQSSGHGLRRSPRLHHVRGHLVRRGGQLFWRVPHLRGSARAGNVQTRTVVWTLDEANRRSGSRDAQRFLADTVG
jgi:hypothetical protein